VATPPPADDARTSVLDRVVAILSAFARAGQDGMTASRLAGETGLPMSTVHRLAHRLEDEGMLERRPSGEYRIGLRLWELGLLAPRGHGLREEALPFLEDLYEVTHQNVQLVVLDDTEAVVVERLRARNAARLESRTGGRLPVHATSGGIALLAWGPPALLDAVLARPLPRHTEGTVTDEAGLRALLARSRRQGYVELDGHLTPGVISLAAPVLARDGEAVAAVSIIGSIEHDPRAILPALLTTARGIGRALTAPR
jgi:DNA-binding IclR family transcriptional regulator